jgi:hypothetical protein
MMHIKKHRSSLNCGAFHRLHSLLSALNQKPPID